MESICCSLQMNMVKKTMAAASAAGLLLCFFSSATAAADCQKYIATGGSVTLKLPHTLRSGQIIKWLHNTKSYVEVKDRIERCCQGSMKDLLDDGSLHFNNLTKAKGGTYTPQVFESNGKAVPGLKATTLCVLDRVPKPFVNFTCNNKLKLALQCAVQELPKDEYNYKWFYNGKEVAKQTKQTYLANSAEGKFHCAIYNQVSEQKSDVVTLPCEESGFVFPEMLWGISIWIFVGAGGGIVLLLFMFIICCCIRNRRRKQMHIKDEEELRLRFTLASQEQQHQRHQHHQHHHHHHPNQQQRPPPGHTGPRHHRPKGHNSANGPEPPGGQPRPSPRKTAQAPRLAGNEEEPPPLPQPRKKVPKGQRA